MSDSPILLACVISILFLTQFLDITDAGVILGSSSDSKDSMVTTATSLELEKEKAGILTIEKECNDTFRIENGYLEAFFSSGSFPDELDKTPKCYVHCLLDKIGVVTEGVFDPVEGVKVFLSDHSEDAMRDNQDLVTKCTFDRMETCECDRSYKFYSCLIGTKIKSYDQCFLFDHSCMKGKTIL